MAQNLTINAIKYTHTGHITVKWGEEPNQAGWWFSVSDTGPGIDAELVAHLNATTEKANTLNRSAGQPAPGGKEPETSWTRLRGEGIGLRIVRQLAQLLQAQLEVRSEAGVGTQFVVRFPIRYE